MKEMPSEINAPVWIAGDKINEPAPKERMTNMDFMKLSHHKMAQGKKQKFKD